MYIHSNVKQ